MEKRKGDWMQTCSGLKIWPMDPRPEEICLNDIAHALSMICRFSGHTKKFYSVAEHSVFVSHHVKSENAIYGLLHDSSEAYISDIIRPVKVFVPEYKKIENRATYLLHNVSNSLAAEPVRDRLNGLWEQNRL